MMHPAAIQLDRGHAVGYMNEFRVINYQHYGKWPHTHKTISLQMTKMPSRVRPIGMSGRHDDDAFVASHEIIKAVV